MNTARQRQIYELLMTPIYCDKKENVVRRDGGRILTGQTYCRTADEDMSDFAIGFYEILYRNLLNGKKVLDEDGHLTDHDFAGDTMNSFNSIANRTPNAGAKSSQRTPMETWPPYLQEYCQSYHCLANFWLLPMELGRTTVTKLNPFDSMDLFLERWAEDFSGFSKKYPAYLKGIGGMEDFCSVHFLNNGRDASEVKRMYEEGFSELLVRNAMTDIRARAEKISRSEYSDDLWNYFHGLRLIH